LVYQRIAPIDQTRGFLLEYGSPLRVGAGALKRSMVRALENAENDLTPAMRRLIATLRQQLDQLATHTVAFSAGIGPLADSDDTTRGHMAISYRSSWA
jgi:transposase